MNVHDAGLVERARKGDETAFSDLFARHERAIYRYAAYMCGRDAADDIVQETFMAVLQQTTREDMPHGTVRGYLLGIARHRVLKRIALPATLPADELDALEHVAAQVRPLTPLDQLTRDELSQTVRAAVESLPAAYREVVVLCELQEMDYSAAATVLQSPIGTVRSRLHRARTFLRAKLSALQPVVRGD